MVQTQHALTILAVSNLEKSFQFYHSVFEWPISIKTDVYIEFELPNHMRLGLYNRDAFFRNIGIVPVEESSRQAMTTELYFYTTQLEELMARMRNFGVTELSPLMLRAWGDKVAYFADFDCHILALAHSA